MGIEQVGSSLPICSLQEAMAIAYSLERHAVHPIADAIVQKATEQKCKPLDLLEFTSIAGSGLQGKLLLNDKPTHLFIGHTDFILPKLSVERRKDWEHFFTHSHKQERLSTLLLIGDTLFYLSFFDTMRPDIPAIITRLKTQEKLRPIRQCRSE